MAPLGPSFTHLLCARPGPFFGPSQGPVFSPVTIAFCGYAYFSSMRNTRKTKRKICVKILASIGSMAYSYVFL